MEQEQKTEVVNDDQISYPKVITFLSVLGIFMLGSLFAGTVDPKMGVTANTLQAMQQNITPDQLSSTNLPSYDFESLNLEAKAVLVYDISANAMLYGRNEDESLPLASITKLMTAYTASKILEDSESVTISPEALSRSGDTGLFAYEIWSFENLRDFMLITSSNDAANAIANTAGKKLQKNDPRNAFIERMNLDAKDLKLSQTHFINESGLDDDGNPSAYGSASDILYLLKVLLLKNPSILEATRSPYIIYESLSGLTHEAINTNPLTETISGLIASKTGFTSLAGGTLAIIFDVGITSPIAIIVLGSSEDGRIKDVEQIANLFSMLKN